MRAIPHMPTTSPAGGPSAAAKDAVTARLQAKAACEKLVYDLQMQMLEDEQPEEVMRRAAQLLQPDQYAAIVEERALDGTCGYPRCGKSAVHRGVGPPQYVSLSQRKVYDVSHMYNFCSRECARASQEFASRLHTASLFLRKGTLVAAAIDRALSQTTPGGNVATATAGDGPGTSASAPVSTAAATAAAAAAAAAHSRADDILPRPDISDAALPKTVRASSSTGGAPPRRRSDVEAAAAAASSAAATPSLLSSTAPPGPGVAARTKRAAASTNRAPATGKPAQAVPPSATATPRHVLGHVVERCAEPAPPEPMPPNARHDAIEGHSVPSQACAGARREASAARRKSALLSDLPADESSLTRGERRALDEELAPLGAVARAQLEMERTFARFQYGAGDGE